MNGRYLRELATDELTRRLEDFTGRTGLRDAVEISREKIQTLADFWPLAGFIFDGPADDPAAREKWLDDGAAGRRSRDARAALARCRAVRRSTPSRPRCAASSRRAASSRSDVFQPIRVALAGTTVSPGIFETLAVLGRDEALRRIDAALDSA